MIKDFDLEVKKTQNSDLFVISSLDGKEEALWYLDGLLKNAEIADIIKQSNSYAFIISESNFEMIKKGLSLDSYIDFYNTQIATKEDQKIKTPESIQSELKKKVEMQVKQQTTDINNSNQKQTVSSNNQLSPIQKTVERDSALLKSKKLSINTPKTIEKSDSISSSNKQKISDVKKESQTKIATTQKTDTLSSKKIAQTIDKTLILPKEDTKILTQTKTINPKEMNPVSFTIDELDDHAYAIIIQQGAFNPDSLIKIFEKYNNTNYPVANFKVSMEMINTEALIIIGWTSKNLAKNYLFGIIRHPELFEQLKSCTYRNVIISKTNLNKLVVSKNIPAYLNFNRTNNMR
jgi:hypothetical protein